MRPQVNASQAGSSAKACLKANRGWRDSCAIVQAGRPASRVQGRFQGVAIDARAVLSQGSGVVLGAEEDVASRFVILGLGTARRRSCHSCARNVNV